MMSYLVRRENFADGTPPPKKPYNALEFKKKTDTLLQGVYGTEKSSNGFLVDLMQKELDKAVDEGVVTMEEGIEFIKSRKKYYDDSIKEQNVLPRSNFFQGALADTKQGKAMSPGTTATGGFREGGDKDGEDQITSTPISFNQTPDFLNTKFGFNTDITKNLGLNFSFDPRGLFDKDIYGDPFQAELSYNKDPFNAHLGIDQFGDPYAGLSFRKEFSKGTENPNTSKVKTDVFKYPIKNRYGTVYSKVPYKNQFEPKNLTQIQNIMKMYPLFTKKDLIGEGKLNNRDMGKDFKGIILTKGDLRKAKAAGITPEVQGKRKFKTKSTDDKSNMKNSAFYRATQGSVIPMNNINNFAHYAPKLLSYLTSTADTGPLKASVNRAAGGYDRAAITIAEKQENLLKEKPKNYKNLLIKENYKAAKLSKDFNKKLPNALKGTLGYFVVNPDTGKYTLKGVDRAKTFAGISGEKREYKKMPVAERKSFGPTQAAIQSLIDLVKKKVPGADIKRASNAPIPPKTLDAKMFKGAFKGMPGGSGDRPLKDPLGGQIDLIDVKELIKKPYE